MAEQEETKESQLVLATREHFIKRMAEGNPIHNWFQHHVEQVERWALKILDYYSNADREVVLAAVWLHDIGQENRENFATHEIFSEIETRRFFGSNGVGQEKIDKVAHCVRTHRCKPDAMPESDEAKIVAAADSASHITDMVYIHMLNHGSSKKSVLAKLGRDIRDTQQLPQPLQEQLVPLQKAWKKLITAFPEE
jgi:HD superfamily phosphodiesterase